MLQQSVAFKKFMWKLVELFAIAGWASQYNKVDIMPRSAFNTAYRYRMLKMVNIFVIAFFKLRFAVIAGIALRFQFGLHLLRAKSAGYRPLFRFVSVRGNVGHEPATLCTSVSPSILMEHIFMCACILAMIGNQPIFVSLIVFSIPLVYSLFIGLVIELFSFADMLFVGQRPCIRTCLSAVLALSRETIFLALVFRKRRGRFPGLLTIRVSTLLHRGVMRYHVHDKVRSLSGRGCCKHRPASSCLIPQLYHEPASQATSQYKGGL